MLLFILVFKNIYKPILYNNNLTHSKKDILAVALKNIRHRFAMAVKIGLLAEGFDDPPLLLDCLCYVLGLLMQLQKQI